MAVRSGNHSSEVRGWAASVLGKLGEHAAPAVPALTKYHAEAKAAEEAWQREANEAYAAGLWNPSPNR